MPDRLEKLRATLHDLEAELSSVDTLDDETRAALETLMAEISQTLQKKEANEPHESNTLISRLQEAAGDFESSHPTLFGIVTRITDALGQMGI